MKKVLGLDLGTTSIGWALVQQAESREETSSIVKVGVRVNPLTVDEKNNFERGKAVTTNEGRTQKRSMRRSLQRYKQRRAHLLSILKREGWINDSTVLSEDGPGTTYETIKLRSEAVTKEISLEELSRVLLTINKKRGYKSSRKASSGEEDGQLVDGMEVAKALYEKSLTPGQYSLELVKAGKKILPDYYRSDLEKEFSSIWNKQRGYVPQILTDDFKASLLPLGRVGVSKQFKDVYGIYTADIKGKDRKITSLVWRCDALRQSIETDKLAYILADIREEIRQSSGYLGAISDRSKELYFNNLTVGQYLYGKLLSEPGYSTRNVVFYRQDYMDEFERIWECQKQFHSNLTEELKKEIRDIVIFYQRPLKSQKGLISFCPFESKSVKVNEDGKLKTKTHGCRVAPKSSLLFQEFKIWQILNNLEISNIESGERFALSVDQMESLAKELTSKAKMSKTEVLRFLGYKSRKFELNYKEVEGNTTMAALYEKCLEIVSLTGHGEYNASKLPFEEVNGIVTDVFDALGFSTAFLKYDSNLSKLDYELQPSYKLWHVLYSYEGDKSITGDASLIEKISSICQMPKEYAKLLCNVRFQDDYASLSHKAMSKILPHLKGGNRYDIACLYAGYNHSNSLSKEEIEDKPLKKSLEILPKGALRNPVVEKIINQMINVVNQVSESYGRPEEIHIELARELKQSQEQRKKATDNIVARNKENEAIVDILKKEFGLSYVSQSDILRYRLYEELKPNGYKALYSGKYIPRDQLFSKSIDIEHIIPQAMLFNDSFGNKTLEFRDVNLAKGKMTAYDYVATLGEERLEAFSATINDLYEKKAISKTKRDNLMMKESDIPEDFLNRDLSNSQYIARKAREILLEYVKVVMPTTGSVTAKLREDWQLVDVMKELNLEKYRAAGKTYTVQLRDGKTLEKIEDWTKRDDHRHHAMDAITIAFTKPSHIQILNNLNADSNKDPKFEAMRRSEMGKGGLFNPPMPLDVFRASAKEALESTLVSIKAKNKVVTRNVNKIKSRNGHIAQQTLTPRGSLHMEQVYGRRQKYETFEVTINAKMTSDVIESVASEKERDALRARIAEFGGDAKKAFTGANSIDKKPIYLDANHSVTIGNKVKCVRMAQCFSIRKEIGPGFKIDKVADFKIKQILQARLDEFGGNATKAFSNLDENPIWLNKEKGIKIKKVTIFENFDLVALHDAKDKDGKIIRDQEGNTIPADYVNLRNNHHAAIYKDEDGKIHEVMVPFYEALQRISDGLPAVNKSYKRDEGWEFMFSVKSNEMFVFPNAKTGFNPKEIDLMTPENHKVIGANLFRVQSISKGDYSFRHQYETNVIDNKSLKDVTWKRIKSLSIFNCIIKVRVNHIGQIVDVGEYD